MRYSHLKVERPKTVKKALELLSEGDYRVVAGSTDVSVMIKDGRLKEDKLLDISGLKELKFLKESGRMIKLGPLLTFSECLSSPLLNEYAPLLLEAVRTIGSPQIRNLGTIGGNLGTGSPAGDTIPPLYVTNAEITVSSLKGIREIPIERFFLGPKRTALRRDELITEIKFEKIEKGELYFFRKLGLRRANAIAVASVAALLKPMNGKYEVRIALGSVAPTVVRAHKAEKILSEGPLDENRIREASIAVSEDIRPITDIRGSAEYRRRAASALLYQGLYEILHGYRRPVRA